MEIKFIGNGSAFSKTNNNAFFEYNKDLVMIDCSMLNMNRIKVMFDFNNYDNINILITHMHADHISGIPNILDYFYYTYNIVCNLMIPKSLIHDIKKLLYLTGINKKQYNIVSLDRNPKIPYIREVIKTTHSNSLKNGCYGYVFNLNNKLCVYTGDTNSLDAFNKYIDICDEAYIDASYNNISVHLGLDKLINHLPKSKIIYLMHLDDEEKTRERLKDLENVFIAELYK